MTLEVGTYRLDAETSDARLHAVVYELGGGSTPKIDSATTPEATLVKGSHLAYLRVDMAVGDSIDATITPMLTSRDGGGV
ncbi:hypothetical protein CS006_10405 [Bifidobacterium primatium]|uniref:Uncharacterized protein n=1 Tax=Bifidobacterium primatium TaxID=2045438 RepID=A0A2M9H6A0_9BIFI|nr:hypothetical protein [Bifidobacterium primatium]PJM72339.1 hypothetical protein CS006_10405 [Bifidobacterium primatium]